MRVESFLESANLSSDRSSLVGSALPRMQKVKIDDQIPVATDLSVDKTGSDS